MEFGIQIPIRDSRTTKTFEALKANSQLASSQKRWHADRVSERLLREDLLRAHADAYVENLYSDQLENIILGTYELIDAHGHYHRYAPDKDSLPLADLFGRILLKAAGTVQCVRKALELGFCYYFSGGMHHAHGDHGSGFCLINDIVIAARKMQREANLEKVWIIDTDAHKGDGTAAITAGDDSIVTLSIHMANGWPLDGPDILADGKPNPALIPSNIDIPMAPGEEDQYMPRLRAGLDQLASLGPADLAIVVSGADAFEGDELPSASGIKLSLAQLLERDQLVYSFLKERWIPAAFLMAGGYGDEVWRVFAQFLIWVLMERGYDH
jgi:acetoin utilization deacetylase AcuC-like enzyme